MLPEESLYPADWLRIAERDVSLEKFRSACQKITAFYFVERYPLLIETDITEEDVRSSLEQVKELIEDLRAKISAHP